MKILFLCGREVSYPLNQTLLQSFRQFSQVDVIDENGDGKSILKRSIRVFLRSLPKLLTKQYDLVFTGFFGQFLMPPTRVFARAPILFHPFISTYETLIFDRKKYAPDSLAAKGSYRLDYAAMHSAHHLLLDTQANVTYFSKVFRVPQDQFSVVFMGSDENLFYPRPVDKRPDKHIILYHGSFLPLQGIDMVIEAARLLADQPDICIRLLGRGLEFHRISQLVKDQNINNIEFAPPVPVNQLPEQIAEASACLGGHFGTSEKAARVIAGKTFQDIAMGKATIVGDNTANHELLTHGFDAWFCKMNDPYDLAQGITTLVKDSKLREAIGKNARQTFMQRASLQAINPQIKKVIDRVIAIRG